ncbi:hypothetical protein ACK3TF_002502 [Chlorella vulgaris]
MAQLESEELEQLMPTTRGQALQQGSPSDTAALREYIGMRALSEKTGNVPAATILPHKTRVEGLQPRGGTGRHPPRRFCTVKWRVEEPVEQQQSQGEQGQVECHEPEEEVAAYQLNLEWLLVEDRSRWRCRPGPGAGGHRTSCRSLQKWRGRRAGRQHVDDRCCNRTNPAMQQYCATWLNITQKSRRNHTSALLQLPMAAVMAARLSKRRPLRLPLTEAQRIEAVASGQGLELPAFITVRARGRCTLKVLRTTAEGATMAAIAADCCVTQACSEGEDARVARPLRLRVIKRQPGHSVAAEDALPLTSRATGIVTMAQLESEELEQLMPTTRGQALQQGSPSDTAALREYIGMRALSEKTGNVPAATILPHKTRIEGLQPRGGTGRHPPRRFFTVKWRVEEPVEQQQSQGEQEPEDPDPEELKDALLEQAKAQRWALMQAAMRPGTGRVPRRREFAIALPEPLEEEEAEEEQGQEQGQVERHQPGEEDAAYQLDVEWVLVEDGAQEQPALECAEQGEERTAEEGVMGEQAASAALQPLAADAPDLGAATPGAALWRQPDGLQLEQTDSQRGQAKTPASSLYGRYTPMEGVPERLALPTARQQPPATVSHLVHPSSIPADTPAGFTPVEGIPERQLAFLGGPRVFGLPGVSRMCSNEERQGVDSPVEGLVQQGAGHVNGVLQPANADCSFAGFGQALLQQGTAAAGQAVGLEQPVQDAAQQGEEQLRRSEQQQEEQQEEQLAEDDDGDCGGGYYDEYDDDEALLPDAEAAGAGAPGGFPFLSGHAPVHMADACNQTGPSLGAQEGGDYDAQDVYGVGLEPELGLDAADQSDSPAPAQKRKPRKATKDPGCRLRNELKRKSLAVDPKIGRHELMPGVRRSCRGKQEPLRWWLNEKKEFGREHMTMPTVRNVVHTLPNTPWQMQSDIKRRPAKKQRQKATSPHDLGDAMLGAEGEQQQQQQDTAGSSEPDAAVEKDEEEAAEDGAGQQAVSDDEEQQRVGGRRMAAHRRQQQPAARQAGRRQGKAAAVLPAAKGNGTKRQAAGSKRKGR